jgi:hypothetical protein
LTVTSAAPSTRRFERSRAIGLAAAYSPAGLVALFVAGRGLPVLRHDWFSVSGRSELLQFTLSTLAWQPAGIGAVRVYPTDYLFAIANTALGLVFGTHIGFFIFVASIAALCIYGARALIGLESNDAWAALGLSLFALFNPWVYVKLVEGHLAMIAAYGALMALTAELWRTRPRWVVAALLLAPMAQLQFFALGMAACALSAALRRERAAMLPLLCGAVFVLPSIVGFAIDASAVGDIPYNLNWQSGESIAPIDAATLTGFFANYSRGFPPVTFDAVWSIAALALAGLFARRRGRSLAFAAIGVGAWALSTGTKGPFSSAYAWLVRYFPPILLYRELYDVLALVAVAYVALAAVATSRSKLLGRASIVPGLILLGCWFWAPPETWWVERQDLPRLSVDAPPNSRFALFPDVHPVRFEGHGSGVDPDAYARYGNVTPLNDPDTPYPAQVALRIFDQTGDARPMRDLGVSRIYERPWFSSDLDTASGVSALPSKPPATPATPLAGASSIRAAPELSLIEGISVTRSLPRIGTGQIFYGDVAGRAGPDVPAGWSRYEPVYPIRAPHDYLSATDGWVDVRNAFAGQTELGEALGGALTTSAGASLPLRGGNRAVLAHVRGLLVSTSGSALSGTTRGYAWIALPPGTTGVRCLGECAIAAEGTPPPLPASGVPLARAISFHAPTPWFTWATLPARRSETVLKYLVGYDRAMTALTPAGVLTHVRIEATVNGWIVPGHARNLPVLIIDAVSASQSVFELLGLALAAGLSWHVARGSAPPPRTTS